GTFYFFFFQAEDGIRDWSVTGVQTCALPIFEHAQVLLCLVDDLAIPFDNNQAEQDLRMLKVQQKIAGSFRAQSGSEAFARIRGYCASLRKQGVALLAALQTAFTGQPLYPALD